MIQLIITSLLILAGAIFTMISVIGLIRFKDFYSRIHAITKTTSFGFSLILLGSAVYFDETHYYIKSILIVVFIYITAPMAAHALAKSYRDKQ